jgi:hypothetical protein
VKFYGICTKITNSINIPTSQNDKKSLPWTPYCRWASTLILMTAISDIDLFYSDIGDKYVGLKTFIPVSEVFRYQHQSPFRYPTLKKEVIFSGGFEFEPLDLVHERYNTQLHCFSVTVWMSDIGYRIKLYSEIRYNVGLRSLSPISEILISGSVRYCWWRISDCVATYGEHPNSSISCQQLPLHVLPNLIISHFFENQVTFSKVT